MTDDSERHPQTVRGNSSVRAFPRDRIQQRPDVEIFGELLQVIVIDSGLLTTDETVKKLATLTADFTVETGALTTCLEVRRRVFEEPEIAVGDISPMPLLFDDEAHHLSPCRI
ncbi:hypothetical protein ACFWY5_57305 [Nonomuraea sp. NPDC059007]|uniref:hypothetical protein n=1 Tax=Nonomuraea sp. NPDC059007 TaxID=3346692 RepID=UPI00368E1D72